MRRPPARVIRSRSRAVSSVLAAVAVLVAGTFWWTPAARATDTSMPGTAVATAAVLGVVPQVGGTNLTVTFGGSRTSYQGADAFASSQAVDLGGFGTLLTDTAVCGSTMVKPSQLPAPLVAESDAGASSHQQSADVVGTESVGVKPAPLSATATTRPVTFTIPGLVDVGGTSTTSVSFDSAGGTGTASATSSVQVSLLGGLVTIDGVAWSATQSLHAGRSSSTDFSLGRLSIRLLPGAKPVTFTLAHEQSLGALANAVNALLAPLGLALIPPQQTTDPATGAVSMGPLTLHFSGSALDKAVLGPALSTFVKAETALFSALPNTTDCKQLPGLLRNLRGPFDSVYAVVAGIAQGTGSFDVYLGGATANVTAAGAYRNPFGGGAGAGAAGSGPPASGGTGAGPARVAAVAADPNGPPSARPSSVAPPVTTPQASAQQPDSQLAALVHCVSESAGHGCWSGQAVVAGAVALLAGGALLAAELAYDRQGSRRTRRRRSGR